MKQFCVPAFISKLSTLVGDNSLRLTVDCQEMSPEQEAELLRIKRKQGWFFFLESPSEDIDLDELPEIRLDDGEKSPSERLRAVYWRYWNQNYESGAIKLDFDVWYRTQMNRLIESVKEKLN